MNFEEYLIKETANLAFLWCNQGARSGVTNQRIEDGSILCETVMIFNSSGASDGSKRRIEATYILALNTN